MGATSVVRELQIPTADMLADNSFADTDAQKAQLRENERLYLEYRKMIESELGQRFRFLMKDGPEAIAARKVRKSYRFLLLNQPQTIVRLTKSMATSVFRARNAAQAQQQRRDH